MKETYHSESAIICKETEELLKKQPIYTAFQLSESITLKLIHELETSQHKLRMLNCELRLAQDQAKVAINKYESLQRKMFSNMVDVIVIINREGTTRYNSANMEKWFGWKTEEIVGISIWENMYPEDLGAVQNFIESLLAKPNATEKIECRYKCKTLDYKWIEFTAVNLTNDPDVEGILCNFHDISERIQSEKQLKLLSKAIDQSPVTIVITNKEGNIEYVNPKFAEVTGYSIDEVTGKNPRFLQSGNQTNEFYKDLWKTILAGNDWHGEFQNKKKNGDPYWESAVISSIMNTRGEIAYFFAVKEDITEKKKIVEDLIKAKEKAEESDRLKSAFLTNMSHEIRTPMNGIMGFSDLLKEPNLSGELKQEYISVIEKSGTRLLDIINDIIEISKIESGLIKAAVSETNINEQTEYIYNFFKPEVDQKGIEFSVKNVLRYQEAIIKTDKEKIETILSNLVKNAIKFTQTGAIEFGYVKKVEYLEFFVKDTGAGIQKEHMEIIFERFRQGNESLSRYYEGVGLGLAITKAYVEILGGKIWVESDGNKGSTFFFTIPYLNCLSA